MAFKNAVYSKKRKKLIYIVSPALFYAPVANYVLLYSTLLCKNNAHALGDHKTYIPTKLGGDRLDPKNDRNDDQLPAWKKIVLLDIVKILQDSYKTLLILTLFLLHGLLLERILQY